VEAMNNLDECLWRRKQAIDQQIEALIREREEIDQTLGIFDPSVHLLQRIPWEQSEAGKMIVQAKPVLVKSPAHKHPYDLLWIVSAIAGLLFLFAFQSKHKQPDLQQQFSHATPAQMN
jgi:hypothetical protein